MTYVTRKTLERLDTSAWRDYRKKSATPAIRMIGPFEVATREGDHRCLDGYVAIDAHGWPYPIAKDEFEAVYEPAVPR